LINNDKLTVTNGQDEELQRTQPVGGFEHGEPVVPEGVREGRHGDVSSNLKEDHISPFEEFNNYTKLAAGKMAKVNKRRTDT
jgi:hypothetical protein